MKEFWITKRGDVPASSPTAQINWYFNDGPPGKEDGIYGFATLEEGMAKLAPAIFHWEGEYPAIALGPFLDIGCRLVHSMQVVWQQAINALGPNLGGHSVLDLMVDNFPRIPLDDLKKIIKAAGIRT